MRSMICLGKYSPCEKWIPHQGFCVLRGFHTKWLYRRVLFFGCLFSIASTGFAFSLLTHEHIVDLAWKESIQPLLLKRFPQASGEDLRIAYAHAYGGCLIHDIGYYPFGSKFFSDLTHYVRTGDFVQNLILEATNINEYAFALGALAHYSSDASAHPTINLAVGITFPKLRAKYGDSVTFADDPLAHTRVEFGFDVTQVAKNRYTSQQYRNFIGFQVSKPVLERAFCKTYGLNISAVLKNEDLALGSFRRAASTFVPKLTRAAAAARKQELLKEDPNFDEKKFVYDLSRREYEEEWGTTYQKPGFFTRLLGYLVLIISKIGVTRSADVAIPSPETEALYLQSVDKTVVFYRSLLQQIGQGNYRLANVDFDTGERPCAGEYPLGDKTYARLLNEHAKKEFRFLSAELREDILTFYSGANPELKSRKERKAWQKTQRQLEMLRRLAPGSALTPP